MKKPAIDWPSEASSLSRELENQGSPDMGATGPATPGLATKNLSSSIRLALASNDGPIDDYLNLLDLFEARQPGSIYPTNELKRVIEDPAEMDATSTNSVYPPDAQTASAAFIRLRGLADELCRVAELLLLEPSSHAISFSKTTAQSVENRAAFADVKSEAVRILSVRRRRDKVLSASLFGEPAWDMLIDLFSQDDPEAPISSKSLSVASGAPLTTALRHIDRLESEGLVQRRQHTEDKRVTLVGLTKHGIQLLTEILS